MRGEGSAVAMVRRNSWAPVRDLRRRDEDAGPWAGSSGDDST